MKRFDGGVRFYTRAQATVTVNFPENAVCCEYCLFYHRASRYCGLDRNIIPFRPDRTVGDGCPLELIEEEP